MQRMPTDYAIIMERKARQQGIDLLAGLPFTLADLEAREFMPLQDYALILERFSGIHPEPGWGFRLGEIFPMATHGPAGFGAMAAPTIRDGLAFMGRYLQARTCIASCKALYRGQDLHLVFELDAIARPLQQHCETFSVIFQSYIESAGASAKSTTWRFPYAAPKHHQIYGAWLHGNYYFDAPQLRLEVPWALGAVPSAFRNDSAYKANASQCEAILLEASSDPLLEKVRGLLAARVERRVQESVPMTEIPDADEIAHSLQMSRRTLIRRLKDAETSFQDLKDEVRRSHIETMLRAGAFSIAVIAEKLGYAEPANFTRACKRLFGRTPMELRSAPER